jgi:hypothetical protein
VWRERERARERERETERERERERERDLLELARLASTFFAQPASIPCLAAICLLVPI